MNWLSRWRRWRKLRKARALLDGGDVEAAQALVADDRVLRTQLGNALLDEDHVAHGRALLGHQGSTLEALLAATPADPELDRLLAEASSPRLPDLARLWPLVNALRERSREREATALLERAAQQHDDWKVLTAALEALLAAGAWSHAWPLVERGFTLSRRQNARGTEEHQFLLRAHQRVLSQLDSAEAVTVDLMMRGELDAFSGRNHQLLAKALMKRGPVATRLELVSAGDELREGEALLRDDRTSAVGLLRVGSAQLRMGELEVARDAFERGRGVAPRHFGLVAGLGAVRELSVERALRHVQALPTLQAPPAFERVIVDAASFTALERKVALASVAPLAKWLPSLVEHGARLRVVPLDVRVTDLPDFEALRGRVETRDRRSWDGIGGLAGDGLACVRVESLFELGELSWALAHELAHLVHEVLPEAMRERVHSAWRRAVKYEYAFDQYQLSNEFEFFAVGYTRWLTRRYGLPLSFEPDAEGHLARALSVIDEVTS